MQHIDLTAKYPPLPFGALPRLSGDQKRVAIVQSNYIPWKGYFDLINSVDEFMLLDDVQYTRRDWRNRNKIKTADGPRWLTIPVLSRGNYYQSIKDMLVDSDDWRRTHWETLRRSYGHATWFRDYADRVQDLYEQCSDPHLSLVNERFLRLMCDALGITTRLSRSTDYNLYDGKTERLVRLCEQAGATHYLSGPSARAYIEPELFERAGIALEFVDYSGYAEYEQVHPPFVHQVSALDLIFNQGPNAPEFMLSFGAGRQ